MAFFSRRRKDDAKSVPAAPESAPRASALPVSAQPAGEEADPQLPIATPAVTPASAPAITPNPAPAVAPIPEPVGISVSTFRGAGTSSPSSVPAQSVPSAAPVPTVAPAPAEAPPTTETVPGLRDNVLLRDALRALPDAPTPSEIIGAVRQLLQGHAFLRVKGDARSLLSDGKDLPLAVATHNDQQFMLVYSSGEALQESLRADGDTDTSAMGQPVLSVLRHALRGSYAGIILDHASVPSRIVLPRDMLQRTLDEADPESRIKTLLAVTRTDRTAGDVVTAMFDASLWIAANRASESDQLGIAENRTPDGSRYIEVFSHPLEAIALGRGDRPVRITVTQLGAALAADPGLSGALVDPAGPWIRLSRADLARVVAAAPAS